MADKYSVGKPIVSGEYLDPPGPRPRAVFVAHGMGQQVPFQTLDDLARGLCTTAGAETKTITARTVRVGCETVQRLEITFEKNSPRPIHIYEGYWAPLTEGAVGFWHVLRFLLLGGFNGIRSGGELHRFMFGKPRTIRVTALHMLALCGALPLVFAFVILGVAAVVVAAADLTFRGWIPPAIVTDLTATFQALLLIVIPAVGVSAALLAVTRAARWITLPFGAIVGVAMLVAAYVRLPLSILFNTGMPFGGPCPGCPASWSGGIRAAIGRVLWSWHLRLSAICPDERWVWLVFAVAAGVLLLFSIFRFFRSRRRQHEEITAAKRGAKGQWGGVVISAILFIVVMAMCGRNGAVALATWIIVLALTIFIRSFLIQYLGDVAAYVSPHVVDRFFDLRHRIKDRVFRAAWAVYALRDREGNFAYDRVAVVGHSLGSVVVYDTLNRMLNDDALAGKDAPCGDIPHDYLRVANRTKLLLTFGSPLDKTAFIFGTHDRSAGTERDALVTSVQPLLQDRPFPWVNVWSAWDVLGGHLDFYFTPDGKNPDNVKDTEAVTPILAHVEFWNNPTIYQEIHQYL